MIPSRRMEQCSLESVCTLNLAFPRYRQRAHRRDDNPTPDLSSKTSPLIQHIRHPHTIRLVPNRPLHTLLILYMPHNIILIRNIPEIIQNLPLQRKLLAPVRLQRKGVRVEMRSDVAAAARVGVYRPCSAQVGGGFDYGVGRGRIGLLQADGEVEAGHACAEDEDVCV